MLTVRSTRTWLLISFRFLLLALALIYLLAVLLTFVFTAAVNFIMRPSLEKIDMTQALKSVE